MVLGQVVSALAAVDIGNLDAAEAASTDWRHLKLTLRTEVNGRGNLCAAVRTRKEHRLSQQEVHHRPDSTRQHNHDQHPQPGGHSAAPDVTADIPHQKHIARKRSAPLIAHQQPHRQHLVLVMRQHPVKKILKSSKHNNCQDDGPRGDEAQLIVAALHPLCALAMKHCHCAASRSARLRARRNSTKASSAIDTGRNHISSTRN
jgi:hypothetical protein